MFHIDRIRPVCLPDDKKLRKRDYSYENPFVVGFSAMSKRDVRAQVLMQLQVTVIDNKICRETVRKGGAIYADIQIKNHVLCARFSGEGIWLGDYGDPLMLPIYQNGSFPFYQIGIASFAYRSAQDGVPDIYTSVQYHADWIKEQLPQSPDNRQINKITNVIANFWPFSGTKKSLAK